MSSDGLVVLAFFLGIIVLLFLVTLHELGHFLIAKVSGAYVYEFSIGFGPRLFCFKGKETWVSIRIFPLGGYCSIASDKVDPPKGREDDIVPPERQMDYIARWKKAFFIIAGPLVNLFIAMILFCMTFLITMNNPNDMQFYGAKYDQNMIAYNLLKKGLSKNENIEKTVLMGWEICDSTDNKTIYFNNIRDNNGDSIVVPDPSKDLLYSEPSRALKAKTYYKTVYNFIDNLKDIVSKDKDWSKKPVKIRFAYKMLKNNYSDDLKDPLGLTPWSDSYDNYDKEKKDNSHYYKYYCYGDNVGISAPTRHFKNSSSALGYGFKYTFTQSISILKSFSLLFTGHFSQLSGPVGMAQQFAALLKSGSSFSLYVGLISANLFIMNMIFIPPLDGYKFIENIIEMIIRREINEKFKIWFYSVGVILFVLLFIGITIKDFVV